LSQGATDWLDKIYIYAALAAVPTLQQAQELLREQGIVADESRLRAYQRQAAQRIRQVADRGLPQRLYGLLSCDIYERINAMARRLEERLINSDWQEKTDVELVDKYLKLMQMLVEVQAERQDDSDQSPDGSNGELGLEEIISRFEQAQERQKTKDAIRQAAAATGTSFAAVGELG